MDSSIDHKRSSSLDEKNPVSPIDEKDEASPTHSEEKKLESSLTTTEDSEHHDHQLRDTRSGSKVPSSRNSSFIHPTSTLTRKKSASENGDLEAQDSKDGEEEGNGSEDCNQPETTMQKVVSLALTSRSAASIKDPGPPPDGGWTAWGQCLAGHLVVMATWGYINGFGAFQSYYTTALNRSPSDISWIGTVQVWLVFFIGTFSGRATDAGLFRRVYILGLILTLLGIFMTSLAKTYWQVFLAQGVCQGIGNGLIFASAMTLVATYFKKRRAFGIGLTAAGSATGGLIYPTMVRQLLPQVGFGWTIRTLGFLNLGMFAVTLVLFKVRLPPRKTGPLLELKAFTEAPYTLFLIGMWLIFWGLYFIFFYIAAYSRDIMGLGYVESLNLLLILNGVGMVTRILPPLLADMYTGPLNMMIPFAFASGICLFAWSGVTSIPGLYILVSFAGLACQGTQGLFPSIVASLTDDYSRIGTRLGMAFSFVSFACLTGPPLAGALISSDKDGSYLKAQMWAGTVVTAGSVVLILARAAKVGWVWSMRV